MRLSIQYNTLRDSHSLGRDFPVCSFYLNFIVISIKKLKLTLSSTEVATWDTADTEIKLPPSPPPPPPPPPTYRKCKPGQAIKKSLLYKHGEGQSLAWHASPADRTSTHRGYLISAFSVRSTSFFLTFCHGFALGVTFAVY